MLDFHEHPANWGVMPQINVLGHAIPTYGACVGLGLAVGIGVWLLLRPKSEGKGGGTVALAALVGGTLGAKLPIVILALPHVIWSGNWAALLSGRTITGGLVGALIAVMLVKHFAKIEGRFGNPLAVGAAFGCAIGRFGCFFAGCCYGTATELPWGVDFGDGICRHPTQLYESAFFLLAGVIMLRILRKARPGALMTGFVGSYFLFRFFEEFFRAPEISPKYAGITLFQWICLAGLTLLGLKELWLKKRKESVK